MAVPATTARVTPNGLKLDDGHSTKIAFAGAPSLDIWERTVTPPGAEAGDAIDTTTMHNVRVRTKASKTLMDITDMSGTAAYDPEAWDDIVAQIGVEQAITCHYPTGATLDLFGFLKTATPSEFTEGEMPTLSYTIVATNWDPTNRVEQLPVFTPGTGTA